MPSAQLEYKDFVYKWSPDQIWVNVGKQGYTMPAARAHFWQEYQREIRSELQKWLDEGWEPVGEVGPSSIQIRTYVAIKTNAFGWLMVIGFSIFMLGLPLLLWRDTYAEPTEFRLQIRRGKETAGQTVPALIDNLAKLRDAGVLTSEEFETKKSELLAKI